MNRAKILAIIGAFQLFLLQGGYAAAAAKTYQVTGPIIELNDKTIVVQKGDERWEINRDESTRGKADLKVGQKVTIHYKMTATSVDAKPSATETKQDKK
jgi:hypothetical protein